MGFHAGLAGLENGAAGVIAFFVLSGFLITRLLVAAPIDGSRLGVFHVKRGLRIYPALAVVLLGCVAYAVIGLDGQPRAFLLAQSRDSALYIQDLVLGSRTKIDDWVYLGHICSLAVEEQFYLFWPLADGPSGPSLI